MIFPGEEIWNTKQTSLMPLPTSLIAEKKNHLYFDHIGFLSTMVNISLLLPTKERPSKSLYHSSEDISKTKSN